MTKHQTADDVLLELWAIKEDTVARHKTVAQYFAHLGLAPSVRGAQNALPAAATRRVRKNSKQTAVTQARSKRRRLVKLVELLRSGKAAKAGNGVTSQYGSFN